MKLVAKKKVEEMDEEQMELYPLEGITTKHPEYFLEWAYRVYGIESFYDHIREIGIVNMYGAGDVMVQVLKAKPDFARWCLSKWMGEFGSRQETKKSEGDK